jgi:hypothetical protein
VLAALVTLERGRFAWAAVLSVLAVWTRQIHVWLAIPLFARAWGDSRRMVGAVAPVAAIGALVAIWGGVVPPAFQKGHVGGALNLDVLVLALGLVGFYAIFFAIPLIRAARDIHQRRAHLAVAGLSGAAILAAHPVAYVENPRRWGGGLLSLAGRFPELFGTDVLLWGLVPLGAVAIVILVRSAVMHDRMVWAVALPAFIACNLASDRAYQKYYEPFLLVVIGASLGRRGESARAWWGPAVLALALVAIDLYRFR